MPTSAKQGEIDCPIDHLRVFIFGRPEQLLLEDDPSFLPGLTLETIDLDLAEFTTPLIRDSQLSASLSIRSLDDSRPDAAQLGLILPSDTTGDNDGFMLPATGGRGSSRGPQLSSMLLRQEEEGLLPEADFAIDAEGNLIEVSTIAIPDTTNRFERAPVPRIIDGQEWGDVEGTEIRRPTTDLPVSNPLPSV